ncbi:MAG: hypothetical protein JJ976_03725 [Rhodothermales bacterium]|nr:hypothetical protein [Rhodothermales bacterium]
MIRALFLAAFVLPVVGCGGTSEPEPWAHAFWVQQSVNTDTRLQAVSAVSNDVVWVSGAQGVFGRTVDGGRIWQSGTVTGAESLEFRDVHGIDQDLAFLMSAGPGEQSRILRTTNGGASWETVYRNTEPDGFFDCMSFWDAQRGIVFSDAPDSDFMLLLTEDGGDTWNRVDPEALEDAHEGEGAFAASGTCLVTGSDGRVWFGTGASGVDTRVYRSADFGTTWNAVVSPIPSNSGSSGIFTLAFLDDTFGLALGGEYSRPDSTYGHVAVTSDGGATWMQTGATGLGGAVFGATFVPGAPTPTAVAVAPTGSVWSTDGGVTWERIDAESYWAVGAAPGGNVFAVGPGGRIARLTAGAAM